MHRRLDASRDMCEVERWAWFRQTMCLPGSGEFDGQGHDVLLLFLPDVVLPMHSKAIQSIRPNPGRIHFGRS